MCIFLFDDSWYFLFLHFLIRNLIKIINFFLSTFIALFRLHKLIKADVFFGTFKHSWISFSEFSGILNSFEFGLYLNLFFFLVSIIVFWYRFKCIGYFCCFHVLSVQLLIDLFLLNFKDFGWRFLSLASVVQFMVLYNDISSFLFDLIEEFLGMATNLGTRSCLYIFLNLLPIFSEEL